jgi:hypothetical protein
MGKVIQLAAVRGRRVRHPATQPLTAFGELAQVERSQLKLMAACLGGATAVMIALQLVVG